MLIAIAIVLQLRPQVAGVATELMFAQAGKFVKYYSLKQIYAQQRNTGTASFGQACRVPVQACAMHMHMAIQQP